MLATKTYGSSRIRSKLPVPSIIVKLFLLAAAFAFSVWLLNQAVTMSDHFYTYLAEVIVSAEQPDQLFFVKNLVPASKPSAFPLEKKRAEQSAFSTQPPKNGKKNKKPTD